MLSRLGSVIGNLFTPLKVKEVGATQSNKLSNVSDQKEKNPNSGQKKKSDPEGKQPEQQASDQNPAPSEPGLTRESKKAAPSVTAASAEPALVQGADLLPQGEATNSEVSEKAKQDELTRKNQEIGLSNVWVEMKDRLSESQPRALQATDAYEAGLKKKRSLLKNSKGGMVDKKAA
jgi:hypothetical protein